MKNRQNKSGQGMTEYIIIVAIIAIGAILVVGLFGKNIKTAFAKSAEGLSSRRSGNTFVAVSADDIKQNAMNTMDNDVSADN